MEKTYSGTVFIVCKVLVTDVVIFVRSVFVCFVVVVVVVVVFLGGHVFVETLLSFLSFFLSFFFFFFFDVLWSCGTPLTCYGVVTVCFTFDMLLCYIYMCFTIVKL